MINKDFDPYAILLELQKSTEKIAHNQQEVAKALNHQAGQIVEMVKFINAQHEMIKHLEGRVIRLETKVNQVSLPK